MRATVYYVMLTMRQVNELNSDPKGWGGKVGKAYMDARAGKIGPMNFDMVVKAVEFEYAKDAEEIWMALQNGVRHQSWWHSEALMEIGAKHCDRNCRRSMDVGDIIVWEDGRRERCASCGFEGVK